MNKVDNQSSGRFALKKDGVLADFNNSFKFDRRLFYADIRVNIAYCEALFHAGILTRLEAERIKNGLQTISKRADFDKNYFNELPAADVHTFIESRLTQLIGDTGGKLLTGKSRAEQIATTFRLWLKVEIEEILRVAADFQKALIETAERHIDGILPVFNQLKKTQPILWAHWCLAYFEMFSRDLERLDEVWRRVNVLPLGSGEAAGTSFEIDREELADALGFGGISSNSLDAVSDRDFAVEFVAACALMMVHLSRLAGDLIFYSTAELGFVELDGNYSVHQPTDNQTALELIRGKSGRIFGHQTALLSTLKGLPTAFNSDLQEDKEAVFDTVETIRNCLKAAAAVLRQLFLDEEKTRDAALKCIINRSELVDYLVHRGISFPTAQAMAGKIFNYADSKGKDLGELSLEQLQSFSADFEIDIWEALSLEKILSGKNQFGGTSPERVFEALETAKETLGRAINP